VSEWTMVRLGAVCEIVSGTTPSTRKAELWDGDIKWITPAEIHDDSYYIMDTERYISEKAGLKKMPAGTVLLSSRAPIGKTAIAGVEMCCNQGFKNLICMDTIHNRYLYYFLRSKTAYLNSLGRGATFKEISKSIVENIVIPLPPLSVQYEIADKLDAIKTVTNKHTIQIKNLDLLIKSRFVEMFGMPGQDEKGWGLSKLGECCVLNPRKATDDRLVSGLEVSFIPMAAVSEQGEIELLETRKYDDVKSGFTYFAEGDVLFAKITPCMENGKGAVAENLKNEIGFGSTEFHILRPIEELSNSYWLYAITSFESFRIDAAANMTGSAGQRRVPVQYLDSFMISLPPIKLQNKFESFVKQTYKSKVAIQKSLIELKTLKQALMQQYFG
jgi:type I restriction enzyme S subunit